MSNESTQESVEERKTAIKEEVAQLNTAVGEVKEVLSQLKVQLYTKFGDNINLETQEGSS